MPNNDSNKGGDIMDKKEVYSPHKFIHHTERLAELRDGKQTVPIIVQFTPSNVCNHRCSFCAYRLDDFTHKDGTFQKNVIMPYEKIIECLNDFKEMGVKGLTYTGGGEPLMHPRAYDMLKETSSRGLDLALITNGALLTEDMAKILADASWVRISLDAGKNYTYEKLRGVQPTSFIKTLNNIKMLVKYKKRCLVGIGFVVCKENYKEILLVAEIAKLLGVDNFRISGASTPEGLSYFDGFKEEANALAEQAQQLTDDNFTVFNLLGDRLDDMGDTVQDYDKCPRKDLLTYVGADYNVYTCCILCYNEKGLIGSIKNQSFKQLWESSEKKNFFASLNPREHCAGNFCTYKKKNEFINYCIKRNPEHVNYI